MSQTSSISIFRLLFLLCFLAAASVVGQFCGVAAATSVEGGDAMTSPYAQWASRVNRICLRSVHKVSRCGLLQKTVTDLLHSLHDRVKAAAAEHIANANRAKYDASQFIGRANQRARRDHITQIITKVAHISVDDDVADQAALRQLLVDHGFNAWFFDIAGWEGRGKPLLKQEL